MTGSGKGGGRSDGKKGPSGRSYRGKAGLTRQPKKMRGRKVSSQRWLTRQLNDPFVAEAKSKGFRSRAALKLAQIDDRHKLLRPGMSIVDLGCAPGGWLQVVADRCRTGIGDAKLVEALLKPAVRAANHIREGGRTHRDGQRSEQQRWHNLMSKVPIRRAGHGQEGARRRAARAQTALSSQDLLRAIAHRPRPDD